MALRIVYSGFLVRHPVGGHTWYHLQYLVGLSRMGHQVVYFEDWGWSDSCFDPQREVMTGAPDYGIDYLADVFATVGLQIPWGYFSENGRAHGITRAELAEHCRNADLYLNLSNINWVPELELCRRRVLIDTDPVFTQIGGRGAGGPFSQYDVLMSYGENVGRDGCTMPSAGCTWIPTRQPLVLDLWRYSSPDESAPFTTVMNWTPFKEELFEGLAYGQKNREFEPYFDLPAKIGLPFGIALNGPSEVQVRLASGGWELTDPRPVRPCLSGTEPRRGPGCHRG